MSEERAAHLQLKEVLQLGLLGLDPFGARAELPSARFWGQVSRLDLRLSRLNRIAATDHAGLLAVANPNTDVERIGERLVDARLRPCSALGGAIALRG